MAYPKKQSRRTVQKSLVDTVISELQHLPDRAQKRLLDGAADRLLGAIAIALEQGHNPETIKQLLADRGLSIDRLSRPSQEA